MDKYEQDTRWLLIRKPKATENEVDAFCEKVAELVISYELDESLARAKAFDMLKSGLLFV